MHFVVTGAQVSEGNAYVWVEGVFHSRTKAYEAITVAEEAYERDYEESAEEAGVEFEVHEVD